MVPSPIRLGLLLTLLATRGVEGQQVPIATWQFDGLVSGTTTNNVQYSSAGAFQGLPMQKINETYGVTSPPTQIVLPTSTSSKVSRKDIGIGC